MFCLNENIFFCLLSPTRRRSGCIRELHMPLQQLVRASEPGVLAPHYGTRVAAAPNRGHEWSKEDKAFTWAWKPTSGKGQDERTWTRIKSNKMLFFSPSLSFVQSKLSSKSKDHYNWSPVSDFDWTAIAAWFVNKDSDKQEQLNTWKIPPTSLQWALTVSTEMCHPVTRSVQDRFLITKAKSWRTCCLPSTVIYPITL